MRALTYFDLAFIASFSFDACSTPVSGGGGTNFECHDDGEYDGIMPVRGTGLTAMYAGPNESLNKGDTFEDYSNGAYAGGAPGASVTGFTTIYTG